MSADQTQSMLEKIRSNFFDFMAATPTSGSSARLIDDAGVVMRFTGLPAPLFNGVISTLCSDNRRSGCGASSLSRVLRGRTRRDLRDQPNERRRGRRIQRNNVARSQE